MSYKIKITPTAFVDLQEAIGYYNTQQNGLGNKFKNAVETVFVKLSNTPTSGSFM